MLFSLERFRRIDSSLIQYAEINKKKKQASFTIMHRKHSLASLQRGHSVFEKRQIVSMNQESKKPAKITLLNCLPYFQNTVNETKP